MQDDRTTRAQLVSELAELRQRVAELEAAEAERKRTEEALRESEQRLASIYNTVGDVIFHLAVEPAGQFRFVSVNPAFLKITGLSQEMVTGRTVNEIIPEPSLTMVLDKYRQAIEENTIVRWKEMSDYPTGRLTGEVSIAPVFNDKGTCTHLVGSVHDITERKRAEAKPRDSRNMLQTVLDSIPSAVFWKDRDSIYLGGNRTWLEALGLKSSEEVVGKSDYDLPWEKKQADSFREYDRRVMESGIPEYDIIEPYLRADGTPAWAKTNKVPLRDTEGNVVGVLGTYDDITERKHAEDEIRKLNAELEQRVAARTAELATANETLRAKNEELQAFAYTVSHDLKAPLRGIAGYAQELDRRHGEGLGERALFCIDQIMTATRNLDNLIEDLLRYSRLDTATPTWAEVNVSALIGAILRDRNRVIAEQGIQISVELPFETLRGWEQGLTQALANVIDNAIKYSRDARPPRIHIQGEELANGYRIVVSDNGIGFDIKYHDRIFGLFNRLVRQEEFEGTGAGLAIAKKSLEKQGGKIWAESQPGAGATFFIELPKQER